LLNIIRQQNNAIPFERNKKAAGFSSGSNKLKFNLKIVWKVSGNLPHHSFHQVIRAGKNVIIHTFEETPDHLAI
jgi:hypothetical protein